MSANELQIPMKNKMSSSLVNMLNKRHLFLISIQLAILVGISLHTRTSLIWMWTISSFIPPMVICISTNEKKYVLPSLLLLFVSQHAIFVFTQPAWGYSFGSDPINDFHVAEVLSNESHFTLGQVGYASRLSYSFYPLLHLFSITLNKISGVPLAVIAVYFVPLLNASLVCLSLYFINFIIFGLKSRQRNLATLFYVTCWYYTFFQAEFVRESFAFPFVLLSLWITNKAVKHSDRRYTILVPILLAAVILSHHISSYILLATLVILTLCYQIIYRSGKFNNFLLLMVVMLFAYVLFIVTTLFFQHVFYFYDALLSISHPATVSLMKPYPQWRIYLAISYYLIIIFLALTGGLRLLTRLKENLGILTLIGFFTFIFLVCMLLRFSTPAHPWSWVYYMSLRGLIWGFIGFSILGALGVDHLLKLESRISWKKCFIMVLVICILAAGKFSQYPLIIGDPTISPSVTYPRYIAALWLREKTVHGSSFLVAPYQLDITAFDASRSMAPYAYLKEYFLDKAEYSFEKFSGYIPLIGGFFDQYKNLSNVQIIYNNGNAEIGYKSN